MDQPVDDETTFQNIKFKNRNLCGACSKKLSDNSYFYFGWDEKGDAVVVGECHADVVKRLFRKEFHDRYLFEMPEWDQRIWRYFDFVKLFSLVSDQALYFCRLDQLGDKYEGAKGIVHNEAQYDNRYRKFFREAIRTAPGMPALPEGAVEQEAERLLRDLRSVGERMRQGIFVNCWHESNHESQAMWQLYGQLGRSIAICSTPQDVLDAVESQIKLKIGRVKYIDYSYVFADVNDAAWRKHISFSHEREVRFLIQKMEQPAALGRKVACDLEKLIKMVVLAPNCERWFEGAVRDLFRKYEVDVFVTRSRLEDEPFY